MLQLCIAQICELVMVSMYGLNNKKERKVQNVGSV